MKLGTISVQLSYEFPEETSNEAIENFVAEVELPGNYEMDTFEYIGVWNTTTNKWES